MDLRIDKVLGLQLLNNPENILATAPTSRGTPVGKSAIASSTLTMRPVDKSSYCPLVQVTGTGTSTAS
jgi:hypothetical protein